MAAGCNGSFNGVVLIARYNSAMNGPVEWFASISGMIAALMIAWDHSRRITGYGFILFCTTSVAWIVGGIINGQAPLAIQNVVLLAINIFGVYQYLIRKKDDKKEKPA